MITEDMAVAFVKTFGDDKITGKWKFTAGTLTYVTEGDYLSLEDNKEDNPLSCFETQLFLQRVNLPWVDAILPKALKNSEFHYILGDINIYTEFPCTIVKAYNYYAIMDPDRKWWTQSADGAALLQHAADKYFIQNTTDVARELAKMSPRVMVTTIDRIIANKEDDFLTAFREAVLEGYEYV